MGIMSGRRARARAYETKVVTDAVALPEQQPEPAPSPDQENPPGALEPEIEAPAVEEAPKLAPQKSFGKKRSN